MADFCTHWFRLAHDALPINGHAGLVGTKSIRQNESREASLDYVLQHGGTITEAVSREKWSGEAKVHVSIVNWKKGKQSGKKRIYLQVDPKKDVWSIDEVDVIPATLSARTDVSAARQLTSNQKPKRCYQGQNPANIGFTLSPWEAAQMMRRAPDHADVLFPYMTGDDLVAEGQSSRWIVDFDGKNQFEARHYAQAFEWVAQRVRNSVVKRADEEKKAKGEESTRWTRMAERWWRFRDEQPGLMSILKTIPRYIALSRASKHPIFEFVSSQIHPDTKLQVFTFPDDYSFGVLQSSLHWDWGLAREVGLGITPAYTPVTMFDTFPWPQEPTREQIKAVAEAAVALRALRRETMRNLNYSLRHLYRTLEQPGDNPLRDAHARLDVAVRAAFGMSANADPLTFLLELNLACAAKEKAGKQITPPGLPLAPEDRASFITSDCIQPPVLT
jgi:hypothetical protein